MTEEENGRKNLEGDLSRRESNRTTTERIKEKSPFQVQLMTKNMYNFFKFKTSSIVIIDCKYVVGYKTFYY